jgi:two-component system NtrC family sensor kinase
VVHELNNPLAAVLANLELAIADASGLSGARSCADAGELQRGLADARDSALRLRGIVRDLDVFSRSEAASSGHADLKAVLGSALRVAHGELRHRATVTTALVDTPFVALNESQLGQVLLSVILHACQRLPRDGHGHLHVASAWRGAWVMVEIIDDGPPLDAEALEQLVASKGHNSVAPNRTGGRGLGLALSQRIVVACGGRIRARNGRESGCTVSIELPLVQQPGLGTLAVGT